MQIRCAHLLFILFCLPIFLQAKEGTYVKPGSFLSLQNAIIKKISSEEGTYAFACKDLETDSVLLINEQIKMNAASTVKIAVMIQAFKNQDNNQIDLSDTVRIINDFSSLADQEPFSVNIPANHSGWIENHLGQYTLYENLVYYMITQSSNIAANMLITKLGIENINHTMHDLGIPEFTLKRCLLDYRAHQRGVDNLTDAYTLLKMLESIANNKAASVSLCYKMISIMSQQTLNNRIPKLLPKKITIAHKTGSLSGVNHDAAIIILPNGRRYILVALSQHVNSYAHSSQVIAEVSKMIYTFINRQVSGKKGG
jgi:beta-lactamase class A